MQEFVDLGEALYNSLRDSPSRKVAAHGIAASAGATMGLANYSVGSLIGEEAYAENKKHISDMQSYVPPFAVTMLDVSRQYLSSAAARPSLNLDLPLTFTAFYEASLHGPKYLRKKSDGE